MNNPPNTIPLIQPSLGVLKQTIEAISMDKIFITTLNTDTNFASKPKILKSIADNNTNTNEKSIDTTNAKAHSLIYFTNLPLISSNLRYIKICKGLTFNN